MFGYTTGQVPGHALPMSFYFDHVHPEDREALMTHVQGVLENGTESWEDPYHRIITTQGEVKIVKSRGKIETRNDTARHIIGSTIDFTQLKRMEQELEQKIKDLQHSNENLEQFAYVASHDLQEPLRKVRAFGSLLKKEFGPRLEGNGLFYLERMDNSVERMQRLMDDLLDFSRTSQTQAYQATDLQEILNRVRADFELKIQETQARIDADQLPVIQAVDSQMFQLLSNLMTNALKFTKPGTPPRIRIQAGELSKSRKQQYGLPELKRYLRLTVTDNGIGFEPEYAEKIFAIFQRLHGRAEYEGTGIGLAICRRIVENHRGHIFAESEPDKGATFTVILPFEQK